AYIQQGLANASTFIAPYGEIDEASQFDQSCLVLGQQGSARNVSVGGPLGTVRTLTASYDGIHSQSAFTVEKDFHANYPVAWFGPVANPGVLQDVELHLNSWNASCGI